MPIVARAFAKDNCDAIFMTSQLSYEWQERRLRDYPRYAGKVLAKMQLSPPPQQILVDADSQNEESGLLKLAFVGHDFKRKGGLELVTVVRKMIDEGLRVSLTIISNLVDLDYPERNDLLRSLDDYSNYFVLMFSVPNRRVIEVLQQSDVAILASYVETYG